MLRFTSWTSLAAHMRAETGCSPYSGRGIFTVKKGETKIAILRNVEGYCSYKDEFFYPNKCLYTLEGRVGDQDRGTRANKYLTDVADRLYMYGVDRKKKVWYWFGEAIRVPGRPLEKLRHVDDLGNERDIYRIALEFIY